MRALLILLIFLSWFKANSQEVLVDWKDFSEKTTLKEYVDNQVYSKLEFEPITQDTAKNSDVQISHTSSTKKVIIRDKTSINTPDSPLIVINGYPIDNQSLLRKCLLADIEKISLIKSGPQSHAIYGMRGKHGVVFVEMHKRKWKKLKKEYYDR